MKKLFAIAILLITVPLSVAADTASSGYSSQGIFSCNINGAYAMSIGATAASGVVYVPVSHGAVKLNTGKTRLQGVYFAAGH